MTINANSSIKIPLFIFLLSIYPSLALLATNIREVDMTAVIRPLLLSLLAAVVINYVIFVITRDWRKASLSTTVILAFFFTFGHIVRILIDNLNTSNKANIEMISYIGAIAITIILLFFINKTRSNLTTWTSILNTMSIVLVLFPVIQISAVMISSAGNSQSITDVISVTRDTATQNSEVENATGGNQIPDIYYIILDGYSRADTLEELGYDNSKFLSQLEDRGFYIASCSTSNYRATALSMPAALNMGYLWDVIPNTGHKDASVSQLYDSLVHNRVRNELEQRGYKIISFQTGYQWDEWVDADLYLAATDELTFGETIFSQIIPFEYLFLRNTALLPFIENSKFAAQRFHRHYSQVVFSLDELPNVALIPGPKFVYAHIMSPHPPFVFLPDGSLNPDTNYYGAEEGYPSNPDLFVPGYLNSIEFLDSKIPDVIDEIIKNNETQPVIIIQGDHGYVIPERRYNILNAYYLPNHEYGDLLYPIISPVNTFRVVFNMYFDAQFELLEDVQINADIGLPYRQGRIKRFPETCPE